MKTPAGLDYNKRSESYEDFLLEYYKKDSSAYATKVKQAIKKQRTKRGY